MARHYRQSQPRQQITCVHCMRKMVINTFIRHLYTAHKNLYKKENAAQTYFRKFLADPGDDKCRLCRKQSRFINLGRGFSDLCDSCAQSDIVRDEINERRKQTFQQKYGVDYVSQTAASKRAGRERRANMTSEDFQREHEQRRATMKERYGDPDFMLFGSKSFHQRLEKKYGDPNHMQFGTMSFINTVEEKHGWKNIAKRAQRSREVHFKETLGVDNPWKCPEIYKKCMRTKLERYGKIIPYNGRHSKVSQEFFSELNARCISIGMEIQFAESGGEFYLQLEPPIFLDCFCQSTRRAIEFFGDYWHANPRTTKRDVMKFPGGNIVHTTEIWKRDEQRLKKIELAGVDCLVVWEYDVRTNSESVLDRALNFLKKGEIE